MKFDPLCVSILQCKTVVCMRFYVCFALALVIRRALILENFRYQKGLMLYFLVGIITDFRSMVVDLKLGLLLKMAVIVCFLKFF